MEITSEINARYLQEKFCPVCESDDLCYTDQAEGFRSMKCIDCESRWSEIYELVRIDYVEIPDEEDLSETTLLKMQLREKDKKIKDLQKHLMDS